MKAGWKTVKLADVAEMRPPKSEAKLKGLKPTDEVGFLPMEDLTQFQKHAMALKTRTMSEVSNSYTYFANGDVLMAKISPCFQNGKMGIATGLPNGVGYGSSEYFVFRPSKELSAEWLFYYLQDPAFRRHATGKFSGNVGQQRLPKELIEELEIPLPPLAEQKRIVALLDEAFAGIDEAKAKAEANVQAATDLLESRLSELFLKSEETPSLISDHCTDVTVGYVGPMADKYVPNGIPFLRSQNVRPFEINFDNLMQISPAFEKSLAKSRLTPGDVVVVRTGYPGTAAVIPTGLPMANCADLVILRPMKSLDPNYLVAFFNSKVGKDMVLGRLVGAAQKHFNVGAAKSVLLPIPAIQRQREVVSHISEIRTHIGKLMDNSKSKLSELIELKASTLDQAFAGELTA